MDELFQNPDDSIEVEPPELGPEFVAALTSSLAKKLADQYEKPWTDKQESALQERISALVAAADARALKTVRVIVTRPSGHKVAQEMAIERISKTRSLQQTSRSDT
jgi:hypothetical protein